MSALRIALGHVGWKEFVRLRLPNYSFTAREARAEGKMDWRKHVMRRINTLKELQALSVHSVVRAWQKHKETGAQADREHFEACVEELDKYHSQLLESCWDYGRGVADEIRWTRTEKPVEPKKAKKGSATN